MHELNAIAAFLLKKKVKINIIYAFNYFWLMSLFKNVFEEWTLTPKKMNTTKNFNQKWISTLTSILIAVRSNISTLGLLALTPYHRGVQVDLVGHRVGDQCHRSWCWPSDSMLVLLVWRLGLSPSCGAYTRPWIWNISSRWRGGLEIVLDVTKSKRRRQKKT